MVCGRVSQFSALLPEDLFPHLGNEFGSRSDIIRFGEPQSPSAKRASRTSAHCSADCVSLPGMAMFLLVNLSVTDLMALYVPVSRSPIVKSMVIV
jgi:hypothetical protein